MIYPTSSKHSCFIYALIIPFAIYACETWSLKKVDMNKLNVFQNKCLRTMVGKRRTDHASIEQLKRTLGINDILDMIKRRRLNWFGHVTRRDSSTSYVKKSYKSDFSQKRPKGRPPKRWSDLIRGNTGLPLLTAE